MSERPNFYTLSVSERVRATRSFSHPRYPGVGVTLELEEPDVYVEHVAAELARQTVARFVTGDETLGTPASPFEVDGVVRALAPRQIDHACLVAAMQPDPWSLPFPRYQPEELLVMQCKTPRLWDLIWRWVMELYDGLETSLPNALGAPGENSSARRLSEDTSTPPSSATSVRLSGVSTNACEGALG